MQTNLYKRKKKERKGKKRDHAETPKNPNYKEENNVVFWSLNRFI